MRGFAAAGEEHELGEELSAGVAGMLDNVVEPALEVLASGSGSPKNGSLRSLISRLDAGWLDEPGGLEAFERAVDEWPVDGPHVAQRFSGPELAGSREAVARLLGDESEHDPVGERRWRGSGLDHSANVPQFVAKR